MVALTTHEGHLIPVGIGQIEDWYEAQSLACLYLTELDRRCAQERCTGEYFSRLSLATESLYWWLQEFLPQPFNERLAADQGTYLASRKSRFATLNQLHGLLGGGRIPFDRMALLLAQANVVKARGLELEDYYQTFRARWRTAVLQGLPAR